MSQIVNFLHQQEEKYKSKANVFIAQSLKYFFVLMIITFKLVELRWRTNNQSTTITLNNFMNVKRDIVR